MVVLKNYKIKEQNGMYYIVPSSVPGCPQCGGEMKIRDSKRRKVIFADGTVDTFVLRRYKCTVCGRVHLELPDIMVPHKHYSRSAIIDTINGERNCSAEQSTIYRWNREKMQLISGFVVFPLPTLLLRWYWWMEWNVRSMTSIRKILNR